MTRPPEPFAHRGGGVWILAALLALSCDTSGPTTPPAQPAPPKVLPQAPTSCTFRVDGPYIDDRVGWFRYDVRWFPPEQSGSDPITTYEVEIARSALKGRIGSDGFYEVDSHRMLARVTNTVRAKTGTTNDLHSIDDIATFPLCEFLAQGEDFAVAMQVTARSAAGQSFPATCVEPRQRWDNVVVYIAQRSDVWNYYCYGVGAAPTGTPDWERGPPIH